VPPPRRGIAAPVNAHAVDGAEAKSTPVPVVRERAPEAA
jgi:hypothetical protein